jgi:hypothetical protein
MRKDPTRCARPQQRPRFGRKARIAGTVETVVLPPVLSVSAAPDDRKRRSQNLIG